MLLPDPVIPATRMNIEFGLPQKDNELPLARASLAQTYQFSYFSCSAPVNCRKFVTSSSNISSLSGSDPADSAGWGAAAWYLDTIAMELKLPLERSGDRSEERCQDGNFDMAFVRDMDPFRGSLVGRMRLELA